jgi:hypothetical protein
MKRAVLAALLITVVLAGVVVAALFWFPAPLLRAGLRAAGVETVAFDDLQLGSDTLEITGLRLGASANQRLARLQVHYRPTDLLRGLIDQIDLEGLELSARIADGRIELDGWRTGSASSGGVFDLAALPRPEQILLRASAIRLATPWGELNLPLSAELRPARPRAEFTLDIADARLANDAGRLDADLDIRGQLVLDGGIALRNVNAEGGLDITAQDFALAGLAGGIDGKAGITFRLSDGGFSAEIGPTEIEVASLAQKLALFKEPFPTPWQIKVGEPVHFTGQVVADGVTVQTDAKLDVSAARQGRVGAALQATLEFDDSGRFRRLSSSQATLSFSELDWPDLRLERGQIQIAADGKPERWQGAIDLALAGDGQPTSELSVKGAALRHSLVASFAEDKLTLSARDAGDLWLEQVTWGGHARAGPLVLRLEPGDRPLLAVSLPAAGPLLWQSALGAQSEAFELTTGEGGGALRAGAELRDIAVALNGDAGGLTEGQVDVAGARLNLPDYHLTLEGIASKLVLAADGLAPDQSIPLTIATITHDGKPSWFAPLAFSGTLRPGAKQVGFEAKITRPADALALSVHGHHDPISGRGGAEIELGPLTFASGVLQPGGLAPVLAGVLDDVSGRIALDGAVSWGRGATIGADLALLLDNLAFTTGPARFQQVDGVVHIDRLWPLTTPAEQQLAIGLLDLGLPLTRGLVAFQLQPDRRVAVEQLRWRFAGGTVRAEPFSAGSETSDITVTLKAEQLDLGQLFALTRLDGLSGAGTIHGTLPVRISGSEAVIEGGELETDRPGWLRYRPAAAPTALQAGGANVTLLLQALENFHYEALRITLDGRTDADMDIGLHVRGANPELYNGYPIEFNLNLEGELANILRSGLASYQIPERIREQMQSFGRR